MSHPDYLPTGRPTIGSMRDWGQLPVEERLGVGVVGLHEGHTMLVALRASGLCRAVAGCDLAEDKRLAAAEASPGLYLTADYEEMLAMPDIRIVCIYTPDSLHAEQIEKAFRAGKDVVCTKPLINDAGQIGRLLKAARETGRRLQVGQSTRFYEPFMRQRRLFEAGEFGEVECYDAHYDHRMDWYYEKSSWASTDTDWAYLGLSHPVDLVRWYLGDIAEVHAIGTQTSLGQAKKLEGFDVYSAHMLTRDHRKVGRVFGNYGITELPRSRSLIEGCLMGSKGTSIARYPELRHSWIGEDGIEKDEDYHHEFAGYYYRHELKGMHYGEFANIIDSFARALIDGTPNSPDLREGLQTVLVMDAIVKSAYQGRVVEVPLLEFE